MSILIDADTTFIVQGITGREAVNLTRECLDYGAGAKIVGGVTPGRLGRDRKSTRLNSSHANISYAVFCLKKKTSCSSSSLLSILPSRSAPTFFNSRFLRTPSPYHPQHHARSTTPSTTTPHPRHLPYPLSR